MRIGTEVMGPDPGELAKKTDPKRVHDAAQQFESILIGQLLKGMHEGGGSWLGAGDDAASSTAVEMAEGEFAKALSAKGGFGISTMVEKNLKQRPEPSAHKVQEY